MMPSKRRGQPDLDAISITVRAIWCVTLLHLVVLGASLLRLSIDTGVTWAMLACAFAVGLGLGMLYDNLVKLTRQLSAETRR